MAKNLSTLPILLEKERDVNQAPLRRLTKRRHYPDEKRQKICDSLITVASKNFLLYQSIWRINKVLLHCTRYATVRF